VAWGGPCSHPNPIFFIYKKLEEKKEKKKKKENATHLFFIADWPNPTGRPSRGSPSQATLGHHLRRFWVTISGDFSSKHSLKN
jgi:hypothetical protein